MIQHFVDSLFFLISEVLTTKYPEVAGSQERKIEKEVKK